MLETEFIEWVEVMLNLRPGTAKLDATLESLNWDSLINMTFIAEFDEKFKVELDADKLFEAKTLEDVFRLVVDLTK